MKDLRTIISGILITLSASMIFLFEQYSSNLKSSQNETNFYKQHQISIMILILLVILLIALYLLPYLIKKFKENHKNKHRPIDLLQKSHENKIIKELKNINQTEKIILHQYYILPTKLCHKFNENFQKLDVLYNLCDKSILYKPYDYDDILNIDKYGIKHYKFCINEIAKEYLLKHPKLLKNRLLKS